jgi:mono/diheme cytochrome c family protein
MNDDVRKYIYGTLIVFVVGVLTWVGFIYLNACGFTLSCNQGKPLIVRTPIPTIGHAPNPPIAIREDAGKCEVGAVDLLGAWVTAGSPESGTFAFNDVNGNPCEGNYTNDVRPLFVEANIWYPGSYSCDSCHSPDLTGTSAAKLDLSNYDGIMAGSQRASADLAGTDILGGGDWKRSLLYEFTYSRPVLPPGHGKSSSDGPVIYAGKTIVESSAVGTPIATPEVSVARPSNPGGPGDAVTLTGDTNAGATLFAVNCSPCHGSQGTQGVPNPGSDDGSVPPLNPIDSTMKDPAYQIFATNIDLFVQHGSTPSGPNPVIKMPAWGDTGSLTQQQIANVIAYVISLNP